MKTLTTTRSFQYEEPKGAVYAGNVRFPGDEFAMKLGDKDERGWRSVKDRLADPIKTTNLASEVEINKGESCTRTRA